MDLRESIHGDGGENQGGKEEVEIKSCDDTFRERGCMRHSKLEFSLADASRN